jgi:hypothetical protein
MDRHRRAFCRFFGAGFFAIGFGAAFVFSCCVVGGLVDRDFRWVWPAVIAFGVGAWAAVGWLLAEIAYAAGYLAEQKRKEVADLEKRLAGRR